MTMEQEYCEYLINEGYKQGRSETEASIVSSFVNNIRISTASSGISLETALEIVPEEIRDEVRKRCVGLQRYEEDP